METEVVLEAELGPTLETRTPEPKTQMVLGPPHSPHQFNVSAALDTTILPANVQTPLRGVILGCKGMTMESCPVTVLDVYAILEHEFDTPPEDIDNTSSRDDVTAIDVVNHTTRCIEGKSLKSLCFSSRVYRKYLVI